jgi:hypothetical protein
MLELKVADSSPLCGSAPANQRSVALAESDNLLCRILRQKLAIPPHTAYIAGIARLATFAPQRLERGSIDGWEVEINLQQFAARRAGERGCV